MFYIRADGNEKIGTGHIMRCLSIALELRRHGEETIFILADHQPEDLISFHGFRVICLDSTWNNLEKETQDMCMLIKSEHISVLMIDSYFVTANYLKEIAQYTKTIYVDDLNQFLYPVDVLINYNIYASKLHYPERYIAAGFQTKLILGCDYTPLRNEFSCVRKSINEKVSRILITSGGTDNYGVLNEIIQHLIHKPWFESVEYEIVMGRFHTDALQNLWGMYSNIHLLTDITNISEYMSACDIAVTAGGVTVYELCACGTPSILYTLADNQFETAKTMSEKKLIPWVGDIRRNKTACVEQIIWHIENYCKNKKLREQTSKAMQAVIDGRGCSRLVRRLLEITGN